MPHHLPLVLDKSTLQGLTRTQAKWLFHHFMIVVPPVFFSEILADIRKDGNRGKTSTGSGEGDARMLAAKIPSHDVYLNMEAVRIVTLELHGQIAKPDGRPMLDADIRRMPSGGVGALVDATPTQEMLRRWVNGDFDGMERAHAKLWRDTIERIDLEEIVRRAAKKRAKSIDSFEKLNGMISVILNSPNHNYHNMQEWQRTIGIPERLRKRVAERWRMSGRPPAVEFLPYTYHVARVKAFFIMGVAHQLVGTRKSNKIDFQYFEYLPFCKVFCSGDKLHSQLFPYFSTSNQQFISAVDLKVALSELTSYYEQLSNEQKATGTYNYANFPPLQLDNAITRVYDRLFPNWRQRATAPPEPPMPEEEERAMLEQIWADLAVFDRGPGRRS